MQLTLIPPARSDVNVDNFRQWLLENREWFTSADILKHWGMPVDETHRRWLRKLAADAEPDVISGQLGYKHITHATVEEINHFANWMESQARDMMTRALHIRHKAHRAIH